MRNCYGNNIAKPGELIGIVSLRNLSNDQDKLIKLIESLGTVVERLDDIIDERMPLRFKNEPREYTQEELQNIREFLEKMRNQTIDEYYEQTTEKRKRNLGRVIR
jgi:hypothetical protein